MKLTVPYEYTAQVVPKRCRKRRLMQQRAEIEVSIAEVTDAEAPVAIREHGREGTREFRFWGDALWTLCSFQRYAHGPHETQTITQFQQSPYPYDSAPDDHYRARYSQAEREQEIQEWADTVLFIDGQRWEKAGEPRYLVMTFGLGCNHGLGWGTCLTTAQHYNPNISHTRYFRADQFEQAVDAATTIAQNRGDTKALPIVEQQEPTRFEVLIPHALRLNPAQDHGEGDPFINEVEDIVSAVRDPQLAGLLVMAGLGRTE